jgi:hypothetical protein
MIDIIKIINWKFMAQERKIALHNQDWEQTCHPGEK